MDALLQPCADIGLELEPLVEFRKNEYKVKRLWEIVTTCCNDKIINH